MSGKQNSKNMTQQLIENEKIFILSFPRVWSFQWNSSRIQLEVRTAREFIKNDLLLGEEEDEDCLIFHPFPHNSHSILSLLTGFCWISIEMTVFREGKEENVLLFDELSRRSHWIISHLSLDSAGFLLKSPFSRRRTG